MAFLLILGSYTVLKGRPANPQDTHPRVALPSSSISIAHLFIKDGPQDNLNLITAKLADIPQDVPFDLLPDTSGNPRYQIFFSPDGTRTAFMGLEKKNSGNVSSAGYDYKHFWIIDGQRQQSFDSVSDIVFSPDGKHAVCVGTEGESVTKNGKPSLVIDGVVNAQYDFVSPPVFTADGKLLYFAEKNKKYFLVVNGKEGTLYDDLNTPFPILDKDRAHFFYVAQDQGKRFLVVDGQEGKRYDAISNPAFTSYGSVAYTATRAGKSYAVINEQESAPYDQDGVGQPLISADGKSYLYGADRGGERFLIINGKEQRDDTLQYYPSAPLLSPDGKHIAYTSRASTSKKGGPYGFVVDGKKEPYFEKIGSPIFNPDSEKFAYIAQNKVGWFVVLNGSQGKSYDGVSSLAFSPNSQRLAYIALRGSKWRVVVNTEEGKAYNSIFPTPVFSPDGKHLAYGAQENGSHLIVLDDKEEGERYDFVDDIQFSNNGKHLVARVEKNGKAFVMIDGKEGKYFDAVSSPIFSKNQKHVVYGAQDGTALWWIVEPL